MGPAYHHPAGRAIPDADKAAPGSERIAALAAFIDLDTAPYSSRFSRLLVLSDAGVRTWTHGSVEEIGGLTVIRASYERPVAESVVTHGLQLRRDGAAMGWVPGADGIRFENGARLVVTADDRIVVTGLRDGDELEFTYRDPALEAECWAAADGTRRLRAEGDAQTEEATSTIRVRARGDAAVSWDTVPAGDATAGALIEAHDRVLGEWMARTPQAAPERQVMVDLCWWVLGQNTLHLGDRPDGEPIVVPSKLGYVGLWQWDAYFIALGLRHGAPELARTQMDVAIGSARPDGQLPDVVHDHGVLHSSADLPPGDLETLHLLGSPSLKGDDVPLTKPPLTALTLELLSGQLGEQVIDEHLQAVLESQRWWYQCSDPGGTGWPAYLHPYSSGLDDSPVFDRNAILRSPDLAAYLVVQDRLLAGWLELRGRKDEATGCRARADRLRVQLEARWDAERELFVLQGENTEVTTRSILNLIALLIPELRADIRESLITQITDPDRFGGQWLLPTVSHDDPDFSPERMWRGPVWVNTAWLVIQGLRTHGEDDLADQVTRSVLDLVIHAGGPSEYFNPDTGRKARTATVLFGWSSALFVDLAVAGLS